MAPAFHDAPAVEHEDLVGGGHRRETDGDHDRGPAGQRGERVRRVVGRLEMAASEEAPPRARTVERTCATSSSLGGSAE